AQVVFEDVNLAVAIADQVGAGNVAPDPARWIQSDTFRTKAGRGSDHLLGHDAVPDDPPLVIQVVDETVERLDALGESAFDPVPLRGRHNPGNQIERQRFFEAGAFAVN